MFKFNLSTYLERFKSLKDPKDDKAIIADAIFEEAGIRFPESDITIKNQTLYLAGSSLWKGRVFMQKEKILARISELLPDLKIKEIF